MLRVQRRHNYFQFLDGLSIDILVTLMTNAKDKKLMQGNGRWEKVCYISPVGFSWGVFHELIYVP